MTYIQLAVIGSSIGTISIILIYIYLYTLYRERYMGIWVVSWLILLSRYVIFDSGLLPWKQSTVGVITYRMLIIISVLMFVWSTHLFVNKPFNKWWWYGTISISILSIALNFLSLSLIYKLLVPIYFGCFICIWIGLTFICYLKLQGIGRFIAGYAYILWSILNLTAPFTISYVWFLPLCYAIGGILRLFIAMGILMVYFEKTRIDLLNKEAQYRVLTENAVDVIYYYHLLPEKKIEYINPAVLAVSGYTPEEYYANNNLVFNVIHPDDHCLLANFINNLPDSLDLPLTLRLLRKDNTPLWIEQKCVPIYDKNDHLIALEGIIRDITMRIKLEQMTALFDRMNMVGTMAATVAHEIRNPMTTVRGYLQVLGRKEKYHTDKDKFTLMIEEIDRANAIIREYLSLSREKEVHFKQCSLNTIIEALFPLIQADATSSKICVALVLTPLPALLLDENEIRQLLLNLVRNAIEAMPSGGDLVIRTFLEDRDSKIILSVYFSKLNI